MKERPILFSAPMVRAILDGRKTQTRRVLKRQPYVSVSNPPYFSDVEAGDVFVCPDIAPTTSVRGSVLAECERPGVYHCMGQRQFAEKHSPYGVPGDRLWVKETFRFTSDFDSDSPARVGERCIDAGYTKPWAPIQYDADGERRDWKWVGTPPGRDVTPGKTRVSIHMPRWACRLVLEITGVRVERLNDCSEDDAEAEGIAFLREVPDVDETLTARQLYECLWDSINGAGAWAANPWVWVVEFRRAS
ncbi:hypothetical protein [Cupriavidus pauculus]|uniref:hypothetical protein n=1 Tax=Cupriavidus pauculus TaxID=82633 RepID=UPI003857E96C